MGVRKVGKYTVLERQRAVETTIRLGRAAASLELGIPKGTLSCWAFLSRHGAGLVGGPLPSSESPGPLVALVNRLPSDNYRTVCLSRSAVGG